MRVYVTGARGFVGTRLVARLEAAGHVVVATDRELDVADGSAVGRAVAQALPQAVVHLAAISFVPETFERPDEVFRVNFLGARHLLEAVRRRAPGARVLLVGTSNVYGSAPPDALPFDESAPLRPGSPYAWTKAAADLLGAAYARRGLCVLRIRPFNHTGPGRPDRFVESSLARQIAEIELGRRPPRLEVGNLDAVRDFLDVDDVVEAYARLLGPAAPPGVYNVASGRAVPVRALLDALLAHSPARPQVEVRPERWRPADAIVGRAAKLTQATGWAPRRSLEDTLGRLLAWWREQLAAA